MNLSDGKRRALRQPDVSGGLFSLIDVVRRSGEP
jgi:hypothetical protein